MKRRIPTIFLALIFIVNILLISSCSKADETTFFEERDCPYYETRVLDFGYDEENTTFTIKCSAVYENKMAFVLSFRDKESYSPGRSVVVECDSEGNCSSEITLTQAEDGFIPSTSRYDTAGNLYILGTLPDLSTRLLVVSANQKTVESNNPVDLAGETPTDFLFTENGWAILTYTSVHVFTNEGVLKYSVKITGNLYTSRFIHPEQGITVLTMDDTLGMSLTSIDPSNGSPSTTHLSNEIHTGNKEILKYTLDGSYASDPYYVFDIDYATGTFTELADWNRIDLPPCNKSTMETLRVLSSDQMLIIRSEWDVSDECILLIHRDTDPNQDKPVLTIGGYGAGNALIRDAVYLYNTSGQHYRFEIRDYMDQYSFATGSEMMRANASILADMSSGKGDDIYVGSEFDYDLWGDSGMVMDLSPLFEKDGFEPTEYLPCETDASKHNGKIYKIFPAFSFSGYFGYSEIIGKDPNLTIARMNQLSHDMDGAQLFSSFYTPDYLAINSMFYRCSDMVTADGFQISREELDEVIQFASVNGAAGAGMSTEDANLRYVTGDYLFKEDRVSTPLDFWRIDRAGDASVRYYGVPSVKDTAFVLEPRCVTAVSADTEAPEACMDFLRILLSEPMQERFAEDAIPVLKTSFEMQISEAMMDQDVDELGEKSTPMTPISAESYREAVYSLDTVYLVNINLWYIFYDEFASYYSGGKDLDSMHASLVSRINVYLDEKGKIS